MSIAGNAMAILMEFVRSGGHSPLLAFGQADADRHQLGPCGRGHPNGQGWSGLSISQQWQVIAKAFSTPFLTSVLLEERMEVIITTRIGSPHKVVLGPIAHAT